MVAFIFLIRIGHHASGGLEHVGSGGCSSGQYPSKRIPPTVFNSEWIDVMASEGNVSTAILTCPVQKRADRPPEMLYLDL